MSERRVTAIVTRTFEDRGFAWAKVEADGEDCFLHLADVCPTAPRGWWPAPGARVSGVREQRPRGPRLTLLRPAHDAGAVCAACGRPLA